MSNILVPWKHCVFDSAEFDGSDSINLFHGVEIEKSEVDIRIYEKDLVEILSARFKKFLLELFEVDISWKIKPHVVEPFTTRDKIPGDIDLLIYNPKIPNISKAIEVKIFRKKQSNFNNDFISNIQRIREGINQAEGLLRLGFSSVFLMPIIIANTSIYENRNLATRTVSESNWGKIKNEFSRHIRERKIGLTA